MTQDNIKDILREGIVEKSIQTLRNHGKSDREIKEMMLQDFAISEETLERMMKKQ